MSDWIPVGISNRHFHVSRQDFEALYGRGVELTAYRKISQPGQFAANEAISVVGPKGRIDGIRIVGPMRGRTQLEIAPSDAHRLGIAPPVRFSGDLDGSAGATLVGPAGKIELREGIIIPQRHIHMSPQDARRFGVEDGARVVVTPRSPRHQHPGNEPRSIIFDNVFIRVSPDYVLDFHIDIDEANASGLNNGDHVAITGFSALHAQLPGRRLITENDVRRAMLAKTKIHLSADARLTPAARDLGREHNIFC